MLRIYGLVVAALAGVVMSSSPSEAAVIDVSNGSTSGYTMTDGNTYIIQNSLSFTNSTAGGSGMTVADGATVVLYVPAGITLTAIGANGSGQIGGGAGICVPSNSTLIVTGDGTINVTGGDAGNGADGADGERGGGGIGGTGGGGGGAAIGGIGGKGGYCYDISGLYGCSTPGGDGEGMGTVYVIGKIDTSVTLGQSGSPGKAGEQGQDFTGQRWVGYFEWYTMGGGGGGGGGGAGSKPTFEIGGGGSAGGAGGRGTNGSDGGAKGVTGSGGASLSCSGLGGSGNAGGAAGAEGDAGTLYVSPTAMVDVDREKLSATTHPAAQYTITFDVNNGRLASSVESLTATLGCELPDCVPTPMRNCYAFNGWRTATGEEYYGASGAKSLSSYPVASNIVLYAQWKEVAHTTTTPVPVPHSYFDTSCPTLLAECGSDYEATGLASAKNGCNKVWECYVAGISPTNAAEKFTARISLDEGVPVVTWNPDKKLERDYKIWGSTNLVNGGDWECPTNALHRFFKVTVEMP